MFCNLEMARRPLSSRDEERAPLETRRRGNLVQSHKWKAGVELLSCKASRPAIPASLQKETGLLHGSPAHYHDITRAEPLWPTAHGPLVLGGECAPKCSGITLGHRHVRTASGRNLIDPTII